MIFVKYAGQDILLYIRHHNIFNIFICIIIKYDVSAGTHEAQLKDRHMLWLVTLPPNKPWKPSGHYYNLIILIIIIICNADSALSSSWTFLLQSCCIRVRKSPCMFYRHSHCIFLLKNLVFLTAESGFICVYKSCCIFEKEYYCIIVRKYCCIIVRI